MEFLKNITRAPNSGANDSYMKLEEGRNSFRIVGSHGDGGFINGMLGWGNNKDGGRKPFRWRVGEEAPRIFEKEPKEFFAMKVYNYAEKRVQVLEITQKRIKDSLVSYCEDPRWGDPRGYDIDIIRSGKDLETSYTLIGQPHSKMTDEQRKVCVDTVVNLNAMYESGDPFAVDQPKPDPRSEPMPEPRSERVPEPMPDPITEAPLMSNPVIRPTPRHTPSAEQVSEPMSDSTLNDEWIPF